MGVVTGAIVMGMLWVEAALKKPGGGYALPGLSSCICRPGKRSAAGRLQTYLRRQVVPCGPSSRMIPISVRRLRAASAAAQSFALTCFQSGFNQRFDLRDFAVIGLGTALQEHFRCLLQQTQHASQLTLYGRPGR
ncbi:Uncharacterised protein [Leclercia adecarboxylata]|uniref:Uncharacterized protein n=1 Tax=Leclercia adecarboxylata TaxID=83655 RepID=A0A4U9HKV4_9ENTR|nr:Uncharacterised protein [Leclercia adecarboxylata]